MAKDDKRKTNAEEENMGTNGVSASDLDDLLNEVTESETKSDADKVEEAVADAAQEAIPEEKIDTTQDTAEFEGSEDDLPDLADNTQRSADDIIDDKKAEDKKETTKSTTTREHKEPEKLSAKLGQILKSDDSIIKDAPTYGSEQGQRLELMSKKAKICGFIKATDSCFVIALAKNTAGLYDIGLKQKAVKALKGVIWKTPRDLEKAIHDYNMKNPAPKAVDLAKTWDLSSEPPAMKLHIDTYAGFLSWASKNLWGQILEAAEIFVPYYKYTKEVDGEGNVIKENDKPKLKAELVTNAPESVGYSIVPTFDKAAKKRNTGAIATIPDFFKLTCSYRTILALEGNCIFIEKFKTYSKFNSKDAELVKELNAKYVAPAFGSNAEKRKEKYALLSPAAKEMVSEANGVYTSVFFGETSRLTDKKYLETVVSYRDKKRNIRQENIPVALISKKLNKKGTNYVAEKIPFGQSGNDLSNPEYRGIVKACEGQLTEEMVLECISKLKKSKGGKSKTQYVSNRLILDIQPDADALYAAMNGTY